MVCQSLLYQSLTAGFSWQQGPHSGQHPAHQVPHWHERKADVREELSGMDSSLWTLAEPLKGGLKKSLLTVMLNLMMKGGAQLVNYGDFFCSHPYLQPYFLNTMCIPLLFTTDAESLPGCWRGRKWVCLRECPAGNQVWKTAWQNGWG